MEMTSVENWHQLYQSGFLESQIHENTGLFNLAFVVKRHDSLMIIFQKMENSPRLIDGEFVDFICGQTVLFLENLSSYEMNDLEFENEKEHDDFLKSGVFIRDFLGITVEHSGSGTSEYILTTTRGEELIFSSKSYPLIEKCLFTPHLHQDKYLSVMKLKYNLI